MTWKGQLTIYSAVIHSARLSRKRLFFRIYDAATMSPTDRHMGKAIEGKSAPVDDRCGELRDHLGQLQAEDGRAAERDAGDGAQPRRSAAVPQQCRQNSRHATCHTNTGRQTDKASISRCLS